MIELKLDGEMLHAGREVELLADCSACRHTSMIRMSVHPPPNDKYRDKAWLYEQYENKGHTMSEIAGQCGVSAMTIYQWLKRHGIATRGRGQRI